mgnify:FL=1
MRWFFLVVVIACGPTPATLKFEAPQVVFDALDAGYIGDPSLVVGIVRDGRFEPFQAGQDLPILNGFQGGRWIHVALRVTGVRNRGRVQLGVAGVGEASYDIKLVRRGDFLEVFDLPIPVGRSPRLDDDQIDALAGDSAHLVVSFTVGQTRLAQDHDLVLSLADH